MSKQTAISPSVIPETVELVPHSQLLAHLFHVLFDCQAKQRLQIIPGKNHNIHLLLESDFAYLKSTDNKPSPYVTPKTISYIHSLICDSIAMFHSDACNARALSNETLILEVLEPEEPAVFLQDLFTTLLHYYEEIQGMHCAGRRPKPKSVKHKMCKANSSAAADEAAGAILVASSRLKPLLLWRLNSCCRQRGAVKLNLLLWWQPPPTQCRPGVAARLLQSSE
jgi:hypothetical protein